MTIPTLINGFPLYNGAGLRIPYENDFVCIKKISTNIFRRLHNFEVIFVSNPSISYFVELTDGDLFTVENSIDAILAQLPNEIINDIIGEDVIQTIQPDCRRFQFIDFE